MNKSDKIFSKEYVDSETSIGEKEETMDYGIQIPIDKKEETIDYGIQIPIDEKEDVIPKEKEYTKQYGIAKPTRIIRKGEFIVKNK